MSLLSTASPWNNNETKKRTPSLRKTVKIRPYSNDIITEQTDEYEGMATLEDIKHDNDNRSNRVNDLLNQMSNVTTDDDGQYLADFKPPPMPEVNIKKNIPTELNGRPADEPIDLIIPYKYLFLLFPKDPIHIIQVINIYPITRQFMNRVCLNINPLLYKITL